MEASSMVLLLLGLGFVSCTQSDVSIAFMEEQQGRYLQPGEGKMIELDHNAYVSVASALLNLGVIHGITPEQPQLISNLVKPKPFDSANALLSIAVVGVEKGQMLDSPRMEAGGSGDLLKGLAILKQAPSIEYIQLDTSDMPGCGEACLQLLLQQANEELGLNGSYSKSTAPLKSTWTLKLNDGSDVVLNLEQLSDRLVALEVASFWAAVTETATQKQLRVLQNPSGTSGHSKPQLLMRTFISPDMIRQTHGADSPQYKAVVNIFRHMLNAAIQRLQAASGGRLVTSVISLNKVTEAQEDYAWALTTPSPSRQESRRKLLARAGQSEGEYVIHFIAWISMWGTFFLLLFFALTGCHCLRSMKFKQDSLLYGKNKSD